jgi:hypothetical protein
MARKICKIADQHCTAPAGYSAGYNAGVNTDLPKSLPTCSSCGENVCYNCSFVKEEVRYCSDCFVEIFQREAEEIVLTRMYKLAGYKNPRGLARRRMRGEPV